MCLINYNCINISNKFLIAKEKLYHSQKLYKETGLNKSIESTTSRGFF